MAGGAKKLDNMVQQQQQTSGFNQFGNPVTGSQDINVSNGEYKVSQPAAKKIGYKKLNKMNDAGKPFVDQLDQKGYAGGSQVPKPVKNSHITSQEYITSQEKENLINLLIAEDDKAKSTQEMLDTIINRKNSGERQFGGTGSYASFNDVMSHKRQFEPVKKLNTDGTLSFSLGSMQIIQKIPTKNKNKIKNIVKNTFEKIDNNSWKSSVEDATFYRNPKTSSKGSNKTFDKLFPVREIIIDRATNKQHTFYTESLPKPAPPKPSVTVEPEAPANTSDTVFVPPPPELPVAEPRVPANLPNGGFVNLPEEDLEQQYREGLEEGDIIRGTLGVPESPYMSPDENRLGRLPAQ